MSLIENTTNSLFMCAPGAMRELRVLGSKKGVVSGYYDTPAALIRDAQRHDGKSAGVYITLNPMKPDLIARSSNRCLEYASCTTANADIERREWLLIGFDPKEGSNGICNSFQR